MSEKWEQYPQDWREEIAAIHELSHGDSNKVKPRLGGSVLVCERHGILAKPTARPPIHLWLRILQSRGSRHWRKL